MWPEKHHVWYSNFPAIHQSPYLVLAQQARGAPVPHEKRLTSRKINLAAICRGSLAAKITMNEMLLSLPSVPIGVSRVSKKLELIAESIVLARTESREGDSLCSALAVSKTHLIVW